MNQIDPVLRFWFKETPEAKRFARDPALDAAIRARFAILHAHLVATRAEAWRDTAKAMLAAVIVLDQFSRNMFRKDGRAFAQDALALELANEAITQGFDDDLTPVERHFLYMPFMHSERLEDVERSIALIAEVNAEAAEFGRRHRDVIARFGRYPGRNALLKRPSTPEEIAFLNEHPDGF
jgi:uncharacterized protein (DUF924 family)